MNTVLETTKAALEALDFTEASARHAEIKAQLASFTEGQNKIRARTAEIDQALRDIRELQSVDAATAADRLLAGANVEEVGRAASTEQSLRDERMALNAAHGDLNRRYSDLSPEGDKIQNHNRCVAAQAAQPLVDAILAEAREAAERLAMAHAAMHAVAKTTRSNPTGSQALEKGFEALRDLFHATGGFPSMAIPKEVREVLMPLEGRGQAAPMHVPTYVYGYAPAAEPVRTTPKERGQSTLRSWLTPAWAGARASHTFPN